MESRLRVRAGRRTRLAPLSLVPVLVALATCSGSAPVAPTRVDTPVVTISAGESVDQAPLQFHVRAQPAPATDLTVGVAIVANGCHVSEDPETVTVLAGDDQAVLTATTSLAAGAGGGCTVTATIAAGEGYRVGEASASATVMPAMPDDQPPVVTVAGGASPVPEGAAASWTLSAAPAPTAPLTVHLTWSVDGDFVTGTRPQTVTIPVSGTATVSVDTDDDDIDETDGTVTLRVDAGSGYTVGTPSTDTITVTDNDGVALPAVTVVADAASIVEGGTASWMLSATPAPAAPLTVKLTLAENGDFVMETRPPTVTIPVSGTTTVTVTTDDDDTDEPNGSVTLSVAAGSGYTVGTPSTHTVTVTDNDSETSRVATLRVTQTQVTEGENIPFQIRATRAFDHDGIIKVRFHDSGLGFAFTIDHVLFAGWTSRDLLRTVPELAGHQAGRTVSFGILPHTGYTVGSPASATITVIDTGN